MHTRMGVSGLVMWLTAAGMVISGSVAAAQSCDLRVNTELRSNEPSVLMIENRDPIPWTVVQVTIRGEYYGPENPRDKTEVYSLAIPALPPGLTWLPLRRFIAVDRTRAPEAAWNADTMDPMAITIEAGIGSTTCWYQSGIPHSIVDYFFVSPGGPLVPVAGVVLSSQPK